ncbi:MAG: hypothetical protein QME58_08735 [Bacteroidota bacterium]|nr:hypothetical protein [Bacteroidota bacterium]
MQKTALPLALRFSCQVGGQVTNEEQKNFDQLINPKLNYLFLKAILSIFRYAK